MMTAFGKEEIWKHAKKVGVELFISKPVSRAQLFSIIMGAFGEKVSDADRPSRILSRATEATEQIGGARILLVEDNIINQEVARELLIRVGLTVAIANNGKEAVAMVNQSPFDAVLMDIQMPEMNGIEATQRIRSNARFKSLPIFAMTAHVMVNEQKECLEAGMNAHLAKPVRPERLYGLLTEWIGPIRQPADHSGKEDEVFIPEIPGIDLANGLQRVVGNRALYLRLLVRFWEDYAQVVRKIDNALGKGDMKTAESLVHSIKGVAGNIGATSLHRAAEALEKAIKIGESSEQAASKKAFVAALTPILAALEKVDTLSVVKPSLEHAQIDTEQMEEISVDPVQVKPLLTKLAALLQENNLGTDAIMVALKVQLQSSPAATLLQELEGAIDNYDFDAAQQSVAKIINIIEPPLG